MPEGFSSLTPRDLEDIESKDSKSGPPVGRFSSPNWKRYREEQRTRGGKEAGT